MIIINRSFNILIALRDERLKTFEQAIADFSSSAAWCYSGYRENTRIVSIIY